MTGAETRGYILKFRCVDCGKHEVSADYPCEGVMHMDQIKARIYEAHCKSSKQTARILSLGVDRYRFRFAITSYSTRVLFDHAVSILVLAESNKLRMSQMKLALLRSIELNLNPKGDGGMEDSALARLNIVLGCFHLSLRRKDDQTARCLAALSNPCICRVLPRRRKREPNRRLGQGENCKFDRAGGRECGHILNRP
jgi:hypothetical protein